MQFYFLVENVSKLIHQQWRIQDLPRTGRQPSFRGRRDTILLKFPENMKWRQISPPPRSATDQRWVMVISFDKTSPASTRNSVYLTIRISVRHQHLYYMVKSFGACPTVRIVPCNFICNSTKLFFKRAACY